MPKQTEAIQSLFVVFLLKLSLILQISLYRSMEMKTRVIANAKIVLDSRVFPILQTVETSNIYGILRSATFMGVPNIQDRRSRAANFKIKRSDVDFLFRL